MSLVLVTGGAGFIGSNLAAALAERGCDVVVCDRFGTGEKWGNLARARLHDVVSPDELLPWLSQHAKSLDAIFHMGAISATTETDVDAILKNNVRLSLDLWAIATQYSLPFIYASSAATYGDGSQGFRDDEDPEALASLSPLNPYGWSKHVVDRRFVADVRANRPVPRQWAGLKFFNVYGPNEAHKGDMRSVVHKIYPKIAANEEIELFKSHDPRYPDGGQLRDFVYVKDCVAVALWLLDNPRVSGLFNVGTGAARSFFDLATAVGAAAGHEPRIRFIEMPNAIRARYQYFTQADTGKLRAAGYTTAPWSLEDGVRDYVETALKKR